MISLIVNIEVSADGVADFIRFIKEAAESARTKEPGCRLFMVSRSVENPHAFTLTEIYDDMAALEAHRLTPHYLLFQERAAKAGFIVSKTAVLGTVVSG